MPAAGGKLEVNNKINKIKVWEKKLHDDLAHMLFVKKNIAKVSFSHISYVTSLYCRTESIQHQINGFYSNY